MPHTDSLLNNIFVETWITENYDFKFISDTLCKNIIENLYRKTPSVPMSFNSRAEALESIKISHKKLFDRVDKARERSTSRLVAASTKGYANVPIIIEKTELAKYTNVFKDYMLKDIISKCLRYVVLELPAAAAIIFKLTPISVCNKVRDSLGGFNKEGDLIVGIDLASNYQEICFYHDTLQYPVTVTISTNMLLAYMELSHQSMTIISESCSMISRFHAIIDKINDMYTGSDRKHSYIAVKNTHLNYLKSRDSKTDKIDATILYVAGGTPKAILPKSIISDDYCAQGKILSSILEAKKKRYQNVITEIKSSVLELTGASIDKNANGDEVCRAALMKVLPFVARLTPCALKAINSNKTSKILCDGLIQSIKALEYIDDKTIDKILEKSRRSACETKTPIARDLYEMVVSEYCATDSSNPALSYGKYKDYKGYKDLDLKFYKKIVNSGPLNHLTPASDYTYEEMAGFLLYTLISGILSSMQEARMLQVHIEHAENAIKDLIVPSNISMTVCTEIPSVGCNQAFELVITLGDISRFPTAKDAQAFLGLVPVQFSTGHKVSKGKKLSRKGRSSCKKSLFLGQQAVSTRNDFSCKSNNCSIWKNISKVVRIYFSMIKNNTHYMPLRSELTDKNQSLLRQFSSIKSEDRFVDDASKKKSIAAFIEGTTALFNTLYKATRIRDVYKTINPSTFEMDDFDKEHVIMPTYQKAQKQPQLDDRYERSLIKERLSNSLFDSYNSFYATMDSICHGDKSLMLWFGNNYFNFLDLIFNDMAVHGYAFANTVKNATAEEILNIVQRKCNSVGKKVKDTLNCIKKAGAYQNAVEMTLQGKVKATKTA